MQDLMSKHYSFDHEVTFDVDHLQIEVSRLIMKRASVFTNFFADMVGFSCEIKVTFHEIQDEISYIYVLLTN